MNLSEQVTKVSLLGYQYFIPCVFYLSGKSFPATTFEMYSMSVLVAQFANSNCGRLFGTGRHFLAT